MKSIGFAFDLRTSTNFPASRFSALLQSPLCRHLGHVDHASLAVDAALINQLAQRAPELRRLGCVYLSPGPDALSLPSKLKEVALAFPAESSVAQVHATFAVLNALLILEELIMSLNSVIATALICALLHSPALRFFELMDYHSDSEPASHVDSLMWKRVSSKCPDALLSLGYRCPKTLLQLSLQLPYNDPLEGEHMNAAIAAACRLPMLRALHLLLMDWQSDLDFSVVHTAPSLEEFTLQWLDREEISQPTLAHIAQFRWACHLRVMAIEGLDSDSLRLMLDPSVDLRWRRIGHIQRCDVEASTALSQLPSLTHVHVTLCRDIGFLSCLPQLVSLHLETDTYDDCIPRRELVDGIRRCSGLTELVLGANLTSAQLLPALSRLKFLRSLELRSMPELTTLSFIHSCPSRYQSLESLSLVGCSGLALAELDHLLPLKNLTSLRLRNSCKKSSETELAVWRVPSKRLPVLRTFQFY